MTLTSIRYSALALLTLTPLLAMPMKAQAQVNTSRLQTSSIKKFDPAKLNQLNAINQRYDQRILGAFKGKEALKSTMEAELNAIKLEQDAEKRSVMIKAYQAKHGAAYKAMLRDNQINMADMAREMTAAVPDMTFRVVDGLKVVGVSKTEESDQAISTSSRPQENLPPSTPALRVKNLTTEDYVIEKTLQCPNDAGNEIAVSGGYMTNKANAGAIGNCGNIGTYTYKFNQAHNELTEVAVTFDMQGNTEAIGVLGSSSSQSTVSLTLFKGGIYDRGSLYHSKIRCSSYAPVLWSDEDLCNSATANLRQLLLESGDYTLQVKTETYAISHLSPGAKAEARIKKLRTTITSHPR